jgi:hypothetical protein
MFLVSTTPAIKEKNLRDKLFSYFVENLVECTGVDKLILAGLSNLSGSLSRIFSQTEILHILCRWKDQRSCDERGGGSAVRRCVC